MSVPIVVDTLEFDEFGRVVLTDEMLRSVVQHAAITSGGANGTDCEGSSNSWCTNESSCNKSSNSWCTNSDLCGGTSNSWCAREVMVAS